MPKLANAMLPADFAAKCAERSITIEIRGGILRLSQRFQAGSNEAFTAAETDVSIIYEAPQTEAGSTWGTDGGSIGGASAMNTGLFYLNRSGVSKRWLKGLATIAR
jgi:hypothetical protein